MDDLVKRLLQQPEDNTFNPEDLIINKEEPSIVNVPISVPESVKPQATPAPEMPRLNSEPILSQPNTLLPEKNEQKDIWGKFLNYQKQFEQDKAKEQEMLKKAEEKLGKSKTAALVANIFGGLGSAAAARYGGKVNYDPSKMGDVFLEQGRDSYKAATDKAKMSMDERSEAFKRFVDLNKQAASGDPLAERRLALMEKEYERKLNQGDERIAQSEKRIGMSKEKMEELSDKEIEKLSQFDAGQGIINRIDNLLQNTPVQRDLGTYASRIEESKDLIPFAEPNENFVKLRQLVGTQLSEYVKNISGAAVSEQEAQRLAKNIPTMTDKPETFKAKLRQFNEILNENKDKFIGNVGRQKEGATKYSTPKTQNKPKKVMQNGKTYTLNEETGEYE